jgi:hypothetical protein
MSLPNQLSFGRLHLVAALAGSLAAGCGTSADDAVNKALAVSGKTKDAVYPFAGKVTIDRDPPKVERGYRLVVLLYDPAKPDMPATQRPKVEANEKGEFHFSSYSEGDGISPGKYIVLFAIFKHNRILRFAPPDQLHNLYNDPDENVKNPEFVVDHQAPGKKNYEFNLAVSGKEPVTELGPHALNGVMDEKDPGARRAARGGTKK